MLPYRLFTCMPIHIISLISLLIPLFTFCVVLFTTCVSFCTNYSKGKLTMLISGLNCTACVSSRNGNQTGQIGSVYAQRLCVNCSHIIASATQPYDLVLGNKQWRQRHWNIGGSQVERRRRENRGAVGGEGGGVWGRAVPLVRKFMNFSSQNDVIWCILGVLFLKIHVSHGL